MLIFSDTPIKSNDINTGISVLLYIATLYGFAITNNVMYVPKTTEERKIDNSYVHGNIPLLLSVVCCKMVYYS